MHQIPKHRFHGSAISLVVGLSIVLIPSASLAQERVSEEKVPKAQVPKAQVSKVQVSKAQVSKSRLSKPKGSNGKISFTEEGRAALAGGDYTKALEKFQVGLETTRDPDEQARLIFYQAVTLQKQGDLEAAAGLYRKYLRRKPESGAALNNLAQLYAEMGNPEPAEKLFDRAIALGDSRNAFYRQNYAEFLDAQGRWKDSTAAWTQLIDGNPRVESPHRAMMERYLASAPADRPWSSLEGREKHRRQSRGEELLEYLWGQCKGGQPVRATSGALEALADSKSWPAGMRRELLTVVAVGLAGQRYDPREFLASKTVKTLSSLTGAPRISQGVDELLQLHRVEDPRLDPYDYQWWKQGDLEDDPPRGMWPADGFLSLIRSLGRSYQQDKKSEVAASYFRLAADFRGDDVDPEAIGDLVTLYAGENRLDEVGEIAEQYEHRLFGGKVQAYRGSKTEKIFDYHRTLGGIYSMTGNWGDEHTVTSAIFQLDRALHMYQRLEDEAPSAAEQKAQYTPELNSLLAKGYESTGRIEKSYDVRISAAETYQRNGNSEAAKEILRPIVSKPPPSTAGDQIKSRYSEVLTQVEPQSPKRDWQKRPSLDLSNSEKEQMRIASGEVPFESLGIWKAYFKDEDGQICDVKTPLESNLDTDWTNLKFSEFTGERSSVAVWRIVDNIGSHPVGTDHDSEHLRIDYQSSVAPLQAIEDMLISSIFNTNRFDVVQRKQLETVLAEQDFGVTGPVTMQGKSQIGRILGVDYILVASIDEWTPKKKLRGSLGNSKSVAEVALSLRLIETETSKLVFADTFRATSGNRFRSPFFGRQDTSPVQGALAACVNKAAYKLATSIEVRPWQGAVIHIAGDLVILNVGESSGVAEGQIFRAVRRDRKMIDPENSENLSASPKVIGILKVTSVDEHMATAVITEGREELKVGDLVLPER